MSRKSAARVRKSPAGATAARRRIAHGGKGAAASRRATRTRKAESVDEIVVPIGAAPDDDVHGRHAKPPLKEDRRVRRTRDRLGDALVTLVQQKPFDEITVKELLEVAQVGRSTFYAHFRDKDDLFLSDVDEFLDLMANALSREKDRSDRIAPVAELYAHVAEMHRLHAALVASGRIHDFLELAREHFARGIERRLGEHPRGRALKGHHRGALAHALAGALLSMMSWWIERGTPIPPERMDELYHRLVWVGVGETGGP